MLDGKNFGKLLIRMSQAASAVRLSPPVRGEQWVRNLAWARLRLVRQAFPRFRGRKSSSACSHHQGRLQS